jgi:hypothetical protein
MPRSLLKDTGHGGLGFAVVSIAAFSVWAFGAGCFRNLGGELGMYAAIAAVFLGLSGLVLGPLAGGFGRFYKAFLPAFLVYAVVWTAAWFALPDKRGEWIGAAAGCLVFAWIAMKMLGSTRGWLIAALALFVLHTAGYFAGDWAMYDVFVPKARAAGKGTPDFQHYMTLAKLSWGLFYGLGFGAGIGWVFNRARIAA